MAAPLWSMSADSTSILSKSNDDRIITIRVLLEPSDRVRELENTVLQLRKQLEESERKTHEFHDRLIQEMQLSLRLQDEVRAYERSVRNR